MKPRASVVFRLLFVAVVCFLFFNGRPPAIASVQTADDAVQDEKIASLDARIKNHEVTDDARVQQLSRDLREVATQVSEMRGEERGIFGALAVLQILAMVFQFRKEKGK